MRLFNRKREVPPRVQQQSASIRARLDAMKKRMGDDASVGDIFALFAENDTWPDAESNAVREATPPSRAALEAVLEPALLAPPAVEEGPEVILPEAAPGVSAVADDERLDEASADQAREDESANDPEVAAIVAALESFRPAETDDDPAAAEDGELEEDRQAEISPGRRARPTLGGLHDQVAPDGGDVGAAAER